MKFTINYGGRDVYCEVSPCSWMYPTYGLQVQMSLVTPACNAESVFVRDKLVRGIAGMPRDQLLAYAIELCSDELDKLEIRQQLVDKPVRWAKIAGAFQAQAEKDKEHERQAIAKMKADGYTHMFFGWVHPAQGDDYPVRAYCVGAPSAASIAAWLKPSIVKTDYTVTEL